MARKKRCHMNLNKRKVDFHLVPQVQPLVSQSLENLRLCNHAARKKLRNSIDNARLFLQEDTIVQEGCSINGVQFKGHQSQLGVNILFYGKTRLPF